MGGGGLRVVERNGRVAGVLWCVFHVFHIVRVGPARSARIRMLRLRAGRKAKPKPVCLPPCAPLPQVRDSVVPRHVPRSRHVSCYSLHCAVVEVAK